MLAGMIVLVLFGVSVSLVVDSGTRVLGGEKQSGASIAAIAEGRLRGLEAELERLQQAEHTHAGRKVVSAQLLEVIQVLAKQTVEVEELEAAVETQREWITKGADEFRVYQVEYRNRLWRKAVGRKFEVLTCQDQRVFRGVSISEVSAEGIRIQHESGAAILPVLVLPATLRGELMLDLVESQGVINARREAEMAAAKKRREARNQPVVPKPDRSRPRPNRREQDPVVDSVDRVEILTLRQQISVMEARLTGLESELGNARSRARGSGRSRSAPGSLETWDERASRLARVKVRAELQLAQLQDRLWVIDESYREERKR